jgi:hypothetical protein
MNEEVINTFMTKWGKLVVKLGLKLDDKICSKVAAGDSC